MVEDRWPDTECKHRDFTAAVTLDALCGLLPNPTRRLLPVVGAELVLSLQWIRKPPPLATRLQLPVGNLQLAPIHWSWWHAECSICQVLPDLVSVDEAD